MHSRPLAAPVAAPAPAPHWSLVATVRTCLTTLALWHYRWVERRKLEDLSDDTLRDVGLSRPAVLAEARKRFWQG